MAHIGMDDDAVTVTLSFPDKILSVHGSLRIPFGHITGARVESESGWNHMWMKLAGTNAPGMKMAGTFWIDGGLAFLDYGNGAQCLVIDTKNETYRTVIVQPDDDERASDLAAAINKKVAVR